VQEFLDGTLSSSRIRATQDHLGSCSSCRELLSALAGELETPVHAGPELHRSPMEGGVAQTRGIMAPGTRIGRYIVAELIGIGGMGVVYAADDPVLDRKVALKLIHTTAGTDAASQEWQMRLLREARAIARLSQPNVIAVHDAGSSGDQLFVAMELVEGVNLRRWLAASSRSWREVISVFAAAGRGLAAAHHAGLVHRDFKPDNVLIGIDGRVRVTDFGLVAPLGARNAGHPAAAAAVEVRHSAVAPEDRLTRSGALLGTPGYIAPEILKGARPDTASDQFSFCVALHEALYGFLPACDGSLVPSARRRVPRSLRRLLRRGLRGDPRQRYRTMTDLLAALDRPRRLLARVPVMAGVTLLSAGAVLAATEMSAHRRAAPPASTILPTGGELPCGATGTQLAIGRFLADANHRGNADIVCRRADGRLDIVRPPYRGAAAASGVLPACSQQSGDYRAADFDGDGTSDLLIRCTSPAGQPVLAVHRFQRAADADQGGAFEPLWRGSAAAASWCGGSSTSLLVADLNGDRRADLLCRDRASGSSSRWLAGASDFAAAASTSHRRWCHRDGASLHVGDFNGDGRADLLCHDGDTGHKSIDYADASGRFAGSDWDADLHWCFHAGARVVAGDYNGDGRTDMACLDDQQSWVKLADVRGRFESDAWLGLGPRCPAATTADVNGDGRDDLLCRDGARLWLRYGTSDGSLAREPR
jgi:hypothetical protein